MKRLTRYVLLEMLAIMVMTLELSAIAWLIQSLRLVDLIVDRGISGRPGP